MEKKKITNSDALSVIKNTGISLFEKMSEMARKIDEQEYELLRAREVSSAARQANNAANHVMRACQYDISKADLAHRMNRLALEREKFNQSKANTALAGL